MHFNRQRTAVRERRSFFFFFPTDLSSFFERTRDARISARDMQLPVCPCI